MPLIDPQSADEWLLVAQARAADGSLLRTEKKAVGALYFFGFSAECSAKALLLASPGGSRRNLFGHDLIQLLDRVGVSRQIVPVELRATAERRDVALRYQSGWPEGWPDDEIDNMIKLSSWIQRLVRREQNRKRNRRRV